MRTVLALLGGLAVVAGAILSFGHLHGRAMQRAAMYNARLCIERAYADYARTGTVPQSEPHAQLRLFTNIIAVSGSNYQCALALDWRYFSRDGFLAVSTNRTVLWIDKHFPPKIINSSYRAPLFGGGV